MAVRWEGLPRRLVGCLIAGNLGGVKRRPPALISCCLLGEITSFLGGTPATSDSSPVTWAFWHRCLFLSLLIFQVWPQEGSKGFFFLFFSLFLFFPGEQRQRLVLSSFSFFPLAELRGCRSALVPGGSLSLTKRLASSIRSRVARGDSTEFR